MSTNYYGLKEPVTSLRIETTGGHSKLHVWVNHAGVGFLTLRNEELPDMLLALAETEADDLHIPVRTYYGGATIGCVVTVRDPLINPDSQVISEDGSLTTIRAVQKVEGAGKGTPI